MVDRPRVPAADAGGGDRGRGLPPAPADASALAAQPPRPPQDPDRRPGTVVHRGSQHQRRQPARRTARRLARHARRDRRSGGGGAAGDALRVGLAAGPPLPAGRGAAPSAPCDAASRPARTPPGEPHHAAAAEAGGAGPRARQRDGAHPLPDPPGLPRGDRPRRTLRADRERLLHSLARPAEGAGEGGPARGRRPRAAVARERRAGRSLGVATPTSGCSTTASA